MRALADWAHQFTSEVCLDVPRRLLWLEIGESLRYFAGLPALCSQITAGLTALGYAATRGIAPTLEAAALLAHQPGALPALNRADLEARLGSLALHSLALEAAALEHLQATGLTTIGEVLTLPSDALARRFGPATTDYLQRLLGQRPDARPRQVLPDKYRRRYECAQPIETLEGLLFPLRRLLQEFEGYLRGRDRAIQTIALTLRHWQRPETLLVLHTSAPVRDAGCLFALVREKLERTPWPGAVTELELRADEFHAPEILQADFFDDQQRRAAGWSALLDKLRARLGDRAVRRLGLRDDHRPEQAWCIQHDAVDSGLDDSYPERPLWLLPPTPIDRPSRLLGTPERIEAGWWSGEDASRDYYLAVSAEGARWWLYREVGTDRWFLQGLWA